MTWQRSPTLSRTAVSSPLMLPLSTVIVNLGGSSSMCSAWGDNDMYNMALSPQAEHIDEDPPRLTITVDKGSIRGDETAVLLRVGDRCHVIPDPFASELLKYMEGLYVD